MRYKIAPGVMPGRSKSWEGHNSINTYSNWTSEEFVGIYVKSRYQAITPLLSVSV